ncbi:hypothetical protein ACFSDD_14970 [Salipiger marinus]|jgi:osmotically inducible lipoprotein OsmB|uniref:YMGG-like Gly-zipper n=1 Tax=Salipiger marinus TaxID=555512 RepID=A0A1G8RGX8_9RHOB|nr:MULTISPECIES: hypothetical protein [Salipiger]HBM59410.1 hypothetical protein [Citreicella sp.]MCD1617697.1 hypothetical protein [Salipiger manganoxidans]MEB3418229.1 hypothetical protein [Salipiger manganoxidans]SDJ16113.1 hypothetical protein SAMN04487993_102018 [Salipiger marinus]HBS99372.1 hypothetical protein [Citreicella sp.]
MQTIKALTLGAALLGLAACGDTVGERGIIGAGAGAATAAAVDGDLATGALVGAAGNVAYCNRYPSRC